ncbi:MAG: hypothetical protein PWQ18_1639, partial [Clostridia bacterium]|nr:hypothetical protein [Clostridia bacterium]
SGQIVRREIKTAGGEGGRPFIEQIRAILLEDGELLTDGNTTQADFLNLSKLFFASGDTVSLARLRQNFACVRSWPVLEKPGVFEQLIRAGVQKGHWCLYRMGDAASTRPEEFYDQEHEIPMGVNLDGEAYSLVTPQGAKQRGWAETRIDPDRVRDDVMYEVTRQGEAALETVAEGVNEKYGLVPEQDLTDVVAGLVRNGRLFVHRGNPGQEEKPDLIHGPAAALYTPQPGDVLVTPARAAERGWVTSVPRQLTYGGKEGTAKFLPLLRRLGSIYNRGARSTIKTLDLSELELPAGGTLRLQLDNVPPASMQALGELFEVLDSVVRKGAGTDVFLEIADPDDNCPLIQELKQK